MRQNKQFEIPEVAEEYGDETFVEVAVIFYDPEFGGVIIEVDDADAPHGFYQYTWQAEERDGTVVITGRAVGVPKASDARELEHVTAVDIIDAIDGIEFEGGPVMPEQEQEDELVQEAAELLKKAAWEEMERNGYDSGDFDALRGCKQSVIKEVKNEVFDAYGY